MNNISSLSAKQLNQAARIREQIDRLLAKLGELVGGGSVAVKASAEPKKRRKMSRAGRARIAAAQKKRWAALKGQQPAASTVPEAAKPARQKMSVAAKKKMALLAKARWAAARAAGKTKL